MRILLSFLFLNLISSSTEIKCYSCDAIKGSDLPCTGDVAGQIGKEVDCPQNCGLLLEERMIMKKGSVESTDSRVRRGCVSDGKELVENSEAKPDMVTGKMGCTNVGEHSYDNIVVRNTLCLCNSTLCNTRHNDMSGVKSFGPSIAMTLTLVVAAVLHSKL